MSGSDYLAQERDHAIAKIQDAELLDAAFIVVHHNIVRSTLPRIDKSALMERFSDSDALERLARIKVDDALSMAQRMLRSTYDMGDALLAKRLSHKDCVLRLADDFPGFSKESYADAISYGCFLAR